VNKDDKQIQVVAQRILTQAGWKLGGASLAEYLEVSDATLAEWLSGKSIPPAKTVAKVMALLETETRIDGSSPSPIPAQRTDKP
jgi:transcriptional regulator with XRE-family HTH domain